MDDGAKSLEGSLAMLKMAAESGTTDLVATPHANFEYKYDPDLIQERVAILSQAMGNRIRLYQGCDFHLSFDNIEDAIAHPRKYTINGNRYLLVEFPDIMIFPNTGEIFERLQHADMIPIITHPERNSLLRQRLQNIGDWVARGALVQVTSGSLYGRFGKKAAAFSKELLDQNLCHFIASDAHDCEFRPPSLKEAYTWLTRKYGEELAQALCVQNPRAVLTGREVRLPQRESFSHPRKWYQIWR